MPIYRQTDRERPERNAVRATSVTAAGHAASHSNGNGRHVQRVALLAAENVDLAALTVSVDGEVDPDGNLLLIAQTAPEENGLCSWRYGPATRPGAGALYVVAAGAIYAGTLWTCYDEWHDTDGFPLDARFALLTPVCLDVSADTTLPPHAALIRALVAPLTVTLPDPLRTFGEIVVKDAMGLAGGGTPIDVDPGASTIDGAGASVSITTAYGVLRLRACGASGWFVV